MGDVIKAEERFAARRRVDPTYDDLFWRLRWHVINPPELPKLRVAEGHDAHIDALVYGMGIRGVRYEDIWRRESLWSRFRRWLRRLL